MTDDFAKRAAARASWPISKHGLADAPEAVDLSAPTTAEERVRMVCQLTLTAWRLANKPMPDYRREHMPGRVIRSPKHER